MIERPLDLLNESKGKDILIYCKEDKIYQGKLIAFDIHINLALEKLKEVGNNGQILKNLGMSFIRGENIKLISPGEK